MKISKFVGLAKRCGYLRVIHTDKDEIMLSNGEAFYKANGLPSVWLEEQIIAMLDIEPMQARKIHIKIDQVKSFANVYGLDLTDGFIGTTDARKLRTSACVNGVLAQAVEAVDGELIFYDEKLLAPLSDRIKESEYTKLAIRETIDGLKYIVFMDGIEVLAAILPKKIISKDYLEELKEFEGKAYQQYIRESRRELEKKEKEEMLRQQVDLETGEILEDEQEA